MFPIFHPVPRASFMTTRPRHATRTDDVFQGGGENAVLLRAIDWSAHPPGPVAKWPQTLRTSLDLCLSSPLASCLLWDSDSTCFYNDAFVAIAGASHPAALGHPGSKLQPEIWTQHLQPLVNNVAQTGKSASSPAIALTLLRDGRSAECSFIFHVAPVRLEDGSVGGFLTLATETGSADVKSPSPGSREMHLGDTLRASVAQLRLVADNTPVLIAQVDCEQRFTFVNRPYAARYELEPDALIGRPIAVLVGAGAYDVLRPKLESALAGQVIDFEMEIEYSDARFGKRLEQVTCTPERALDGAIVGVLLVTIDITVREQTQRDLDLARENALAGARAKDAFLAALSHELRTPLNPVLLLASDAAANAALPAAVRADFDSIRKHVDLEARLIDDLLDLTRVNHRTLPLDLRALDLHSPLDGALAIVRGDFDAKLLTLDLELRASEPIVWGDEARLQQVFWSVLKNAVKFTPHSGRITVQTATDPERGVVLVKISDTGIGMTEAEQKKIFESFVQGEHATKTGAHRFGGLGLGLAISRIVVEMHSGHIHATSAGPDRGSQFVIELPLHLAPVRRADSGPAWPLSSAPLAPAAKPAVARRVRVLLVEDHVPTRNTLAQLLGRRNFDVLTAGSVAEARVLGTSNEFQLVISDIGLPDGDGYQLMTELRAQRPDLPGIAITGYGMEEDFARSREAGFGLHLIKPVNIAALEAAIACVFLPDAEANGSS